MLRSRISLIHFISTVLLFLATTSGSQDYSWGNLAMGGGGFVSGIITCPTERNLMYARTDVGGAYRWDEANSTWLPLTDWASDEETGLLGCEALAIDPNATNRVYMLLGISYFNGGKTVIARSDDYGNTFSITETTGQFKAHGNGMGRSNGERLAVDPNNGNILLVGTRANGLFKSTDRGATWNRISSLNVTTTPNENGICFVIFDKSKKASDNSTSTIYVGVSRYNDNLYMSNDGGSSWTLVPGRPLDLMPQRAVLASNGLMYITYANGAGPHGHWALSDQPMDKGAVWKLNTSNDTWTNVTPTGYTRPFGGISVDPSDPDRVITSTINTWMSQDGAWGDKFFLSTNGGTNWTDLVIKRDNNGIYWIDGHAIHWAGSIEFDPFNTSQAIVASGNGIFLCEDVNASTTTWKFLTRGLEETVPLDMISIPGGPVITVIGDYDGSVYSSNNITSYTTKHSPSMGTSTGIAFAGKLTSFVVRAGDKLFYSTNSGSSWTEMSKSGITGVKGKVAVSADGSVILYTPEKSTTTYRTEDRGASWSTSTGAQGGHPVADPVDENKFYMYSGSNLYVSTNKGVSFTQAGNCGSGGSSRITPVPDREGDIWVALYNGGLTRSVNSGSSFSKISSVQRCSAVGFGKAAQGKTFPTIFIWGRVNDVTGLFRSIDEGATWQRINDDQHEFGGPGNGQFVIGDPNVYGRVYMSTAGRGTVFGEVALNTGNAFSFKAHETTKAPVSLNGGCLHINRRLASSVNVNIFDLNGRLAYSNSFTEAATLPLAAMLPKGIYVARISGSGFALTNVRFHVFR